MSTDKWGELSTELRGKHQLLIAGYATLINSYENKPVNVKNLVGLELELEDLEKKIRELKRELRKRVLA